MTVKTDPKHPPPGTFYFVEGSRMFTGEVTFKSLSTCVIFLRRIINLKTDENGIYNQTQLAALSKDGDKTYGEYTVTITGEFFRACKNSFIRL